MLNLIIKTFKIVKIILLKNMQLCVYIFTFMYLIQIYRLLFNPQNMNNNPLLIVNQIIRSIKSNFKSFLCELCNWKQQPLVSILTDILINTEILIKILKY